MARQNANPRRTLGYRRPQAEGPQAPRNEIGAPRAVRFGEINRLRLAKDFELVKADSTKADCSAFVFYLRPAPERAFSRLAVVTSRRVGCAVERNRARRIIREIFRKNAPEFETACDIIVFMRRGWEKFDFRTLDAKFAKAARRAISEKRDARI